MKTLIHGGTIVNEKEKKKADIVIENDRIYEIIKASHANKTHYDTVINATDCFVIPGIIDSHVHFREPGLTQKADIESESRAAAWGGVTSYFDMPNTVPQTISQAQLDEKISLARRKSHVNYAFFFGVSNDNIGEIGRLDPHIVPGIKLFMGSSTGNMLVDKEVVLRRLFRETPLPIMAHCEDSAIIDANLQLARQRYGNDLSVVHHPEIRSEEACYSSTTRAIQLSEEFNARLHVAHISTARELKLFGRNPKITAEAVIGHLFFTRDDYQRLGTKIKCNPAIKTVADQKALRRALTTGEITTIATDHAPHLLADKAGGCVRAASGMPIIQFALVMMLNLVDSDVLSIERLVELMCHNPATLFGVRERGFLRPSYKADITIIRRNHPWRVTTELIQSKCGWSPVFGKEFAWHIDRTICNGKTVFHNGKTYDNDCAEQILFR